MMNQRFRLSGGTEIPAVGFGTFLITPDDASEAVRGAISVGYRHVDTAEVYANEEAVGAGIKAGLNGSGLARDDIFVTTKLWPGAAEFGEQPKTREETIASFERSLSRLGLDHVDLYLIHSPHAGPRRLEQWEALLELKRDGRARAVGVSNYSRKHLEEIREAGLPLPEANQVELHPWSQKPDLVAAMNASGILPIAYSSLAPLTTWRVGQTSAKSAADDDDALSKMAARYGVSEAQFLLRWGIQNGYPVLPKSLNPDRMRQNIDLDGFAIDPADMEAIRSMDRGDGIAWSMGDPTRVA
jgi:2,5-diketo-D-gluconate reductase A